MTDEEISGIVNQLLSKRLPEAGFKSATVVSERDYDGSDIIRVVASYKTRPVNTSKSLVGAVHDIRSALLERGDGRFVFLSNDVEAERQLEEEVE